MIEVFKTNIRDSLQAAFILSLIERDFPGHEANFDLHDCDNILRVKSVSGHVEPILLINLLTKHGFHGEVLN